MRPGLGAAVRGVRGGCEGGMRAQLACAGGAGLGKGSESGPAGVCVSNAPARLQQHSEHSLHS